MNAIEDRLKELQKQLEDIEKEIATEKTTLENTQNTINQKNTQRSELAAQIAPLKKQVDELNGNQAANEDERNGADCDLSQARKVLEDLSELLEHKIPESRRKAIEDAVEEIDADIEKKKTASENKKKDLDKAKTALTEAQNKVSTEEQAVAELKAKLKNLSNWIKAARSRVSELKTQAKTAFKDGKTTEAYYLTGQLRLAIEELEKLIDPDYESNLLCELNKHQKELLAAKEAVTEKTAEAEQLNGEWTTLDKAYQEAVKGREKAIRERLNAIPDEKKGNSSGCEPGSRYRAEARI
jgi:chromosome segregation ATPase